jgi:pimeloyl-ACP methyl ester carboxylesterase
MISVAAAIMRTDSTHPRPDPIVFVDGGPSFGAISSFAPNAYFDDAGYAKDRDVILVDTRGTGLSKPRLGCPELDRAEVATFYAPPTVNSQAPTIYRGALVQCRDRLAGRGIDLAAYNSAESAADLESLRSALGVASWNLIAISADGVLGLTYLRMFPHAVRSAVLDSAQNPQMLWGLDFDRGLARELDKIFAGCAANAGCRAAYPGLRSAFFRMIARLQRHPVTINLPDFQPKPVQLELDGVGLYADALYNIFAGNRFAPSAIPDLLDTLWRETHGQLRAVYRDLLGTGPVENGHANADLAQGKTMSYVCRDLVNFISQADLRRAAADVPPYAPRYLGADYDLGFGFTNFVSPSGCDVWHVGRAPGIQHRPVKSQVPTLVLSGEYDSSVPPYVVRQALAGLSRGYYYDIPGGSHLQLASYNTGSDCARAIATEFLDRPAESPDASCLATIPRVDFSPPH